MIKIFLKIEFFEIFFIFSIKTILEFLKNSQLNNILNNLLKNTLKNSHFTF